VVNTPEGPGDVEELPTFDLTGPLPTGTTLLEASAGTGKTFAVAALVTRFVAEGVATLDEMLVVTFGRAASQELRERVRGALVDAERALSLNASVEGAASTNEVLERLVECDEEERGRRRARIRDALANFDAGTIATTHQFCQLVLRSLGVAGDTDAGATLVESLDDLVVEVADDRYLAAYANAADPPPFDRAEALGIARAAVGDPRAALTDSDDARGTARVAFACAVRDEVEVRKRRLGILSYDDLLGRLADALLDDEAPARDRMRRRWRIVLVDEFQDTDPVQWDVLQRAFDGHATMVLIGDPKQAIYAFRGGDVVTYLAAAATATTRATLGTNWRSDQPLIDRLTCVLRGAALGDPRIVVRQVRAGLEVSRLQGAPHSAPFRIRHVRRDGFKLNRQGLVSMHDARDFIARDCAADIATLLASGATWCDEPLIAGQVAVLVGKRDHGLLVQRALAGHRIPAVVTGGGQVFTTEAADAWLALLEALEQPHRTAKVRAAARTPFFGYTVADLAAGDPAQTDRLTEDVADTLRGWALLLRGTGVAALVEAAEERGLSARVLRLEGGERLLTDLRHVAQTLHQQAVTERLGLPALLQWFRQERAREATPERTRRLDSDAAAVQIVTVHASKGLQYPVTYLPFAFETFLFPVERALFHDDTGRRCLDVSRAGSQWPAHEDRHRVEEAGEELRDLYVALTRAQSQVVTWWAATPNTMCGGLHRLLFGRTPDTVTVPDRVEVRDDDYVAAVLDKLAELGGPQPEPAEIAPSVDPSPATDGESFTARSFDRGVDVDWRRTSYSGLLRAAETGGHATPGVGSEPEGHDLDDEPEEAEESGVGAVEEGETTTHLLSPMDALPVGAAFGSLVHAVLEHADPDAPDLPEELSRHAREQLRWWPVAVTPEDLGAALVPALHTPLGPLAGGVTLADVSLADRLRELDFEIPLGGGDRASSTQGRRLAELGDLVRRHLPEDDPVRPYADLVAAAGPHPGAVPLLGDQVLTGYLSGQIDVVLRVGDPSAPRFVVVDYKTNRLGAPGEPTTTADYTPPLLAQAMLHAHYPLQAILYTVVLHRYLRWRLPGYRPDSHLGGVLYLFLRGMAGPESPVLEGVPTGVFSWRPPADLVVAVSDLLDGRPT